MIWHLSDLHFPPDPLSMGADNGIVTGATLTGPDPHDRFFEWVRTRTHWPADFLVISGDFVDAEAIAKAEGREFPAAGTSRHTPRERAFAHAVAFVKKLEEAVPSRTAPLVIVCPGNHDVDIRAAADGKDTSHTLADFAHALGDHWCPEKQSSFAVANACLLVLDTTRLVGRLFSLTERIGSTHPKHQFQADAALYDLKEVQDALRRCERANGVRRGAELGFVVAHHPPSLVPSLWMDSRPYADPVAAAQAKSTLTRAGFRVFLHGHKHSGVAQEEVVFHSAADGDERALVLGAPAFNAAPGQDSGFNVIEYLVSPSSGEARIILTPITLPGGMPRALPKRRFSLPPAGRRPMSLLRICAQIDQKGDCCLDTESHEIPVPSRKDLTGEWTLVGGKRQRVFRRHFRTDVRGCAVPEVRAISPNADVEIPVPSVRGNRDYTIALRVADAQTRPVSFVERLRLGTSHAVSMEDQRRRGGASSSIPGVAVGWESVVHVMREPANKLEIQVDLPFEVSPAHRVEVKAYRCDEGELVEDDAILRFSPFHLTINPLAGRIHVLIDAPVVGTAWAVRWQLPSGRGAAAGVPGYQWAVHQAENIRTLLLDPVGRERDRTVLGEHISRALSAIPENQMGIPIEDVRWRLYVPSQSLTTPSPESIPNTLVPRIESDARRSSVRSWAFGQGVVGRAFAIREAVEFVGATSGRDRETTRGRRAVSVYERNEGDQHAHSVLYGIPVPFPGFPQLVWGVLSIGTRRAGAVLNLMSPVQGSDTGLMRLQANLETFTRSLVNH